MSQENVEVLKRAIDAFNVRDIDAIYECVTPDLEGFPAMPVTFSGGAFRGREGIESYVREVNEAWGGVPGGQRGLPRSRQPGSCLQSS